ncbi:MAG: AAA family ATPase [Clostridia bacterium]|nr:AAA family ATPase [Clostridia bacterium]
MRLIGLEVENFGVLQNYKLDLDEGLNVLYEKNGWGKSTLAVFIKVMLYGLPASTKRQLDENERKKYTPWQGGAFGGSLEFECARGRFRVERFFGAKAAQDTFALYDLSTNKPSDAFSENLGVELFGIDADSFERSAYLSQRAGFEKSDSTSIRAKLGDLLEDVNDMGNYDVACETLEKRRRFYQMTGNRGAIAEEKKKILDLRAELEQLAQVEAQARLKKEERRVCAVQLVAAEEEASVLSKRREALMRARERATLLEEKDRRLAELADLEARKKKNEEVFCGFIPSEEELNAAKDMLDQVREANAALRTIPAESPDAEELEVLGELFANGVPTEEALEREEARCNQLHRLRETQKRLESELAAVAPTQRFTAGVPSPEDFESMFTSLDRAKQIQSKIEQTQMQADNTRLDVSKRRRERMIVSGAVLGLGVILAALSFLLEGMLFLSLLIGGGAVAAVGAILLAVFSRKDEEQRATERVQSTIEAYKKERRQELARVEQFLISCKTAPDGDLYRVLSELAAAAVQARENVHRRRRIGEQLRECGRDAEQVAGAIGAFVSRYDSDAQELEYSRVLAALRRDAERYALLYRENQKRIAQRKHLQERQEALQANLRPFLKRYDTTNSRRAGEIVSSVSDSFVTYRALCEEYKKKDHALRAFIAEKALDKPLPDEEVPAHDELIAAERALQRRQNDARELHARLGAELERLSIELDRIPEAEAELRSAEERLATYNANFKVVTATQNMLAEAKEALSTRYLGGMQESFLHYLSELTEGEVPEAVIDSSFAVRTRAMGQSREMESFSRGNQDAVRFCVRLSLTEELHRDGEKPFLLLDDPFVNLDEEHLRATHKLLERLSQRYQIIHMICHEGRK